tara:strand:+ start:344656 stop:345405 length:750 start_codon:yes stop_codon:yes gene_type:complete
MNDNKNYYDVLEVPVDATLQEIHNAYIRAKNAYSGDSVALYSLMSQDDCKAILDQIEEAYSVIGVAEKRREYDKARGLNQEHTVQGFNEEMHSKPDYAPKRKQADLTTQTEQDAQDSSSSEEYVYSESDHSQKNHASVTKVQAFQKFGLNYDQDSNFEQEIENCSNYTGEFLKKIREYKNVTVERMADMTRISKTYIRNIEEEDYSKLPADVYTRGFVYQYAKCLKLNPDLVATSYIHHIRQLKNPPQA